MTDYPSRQTMRRHVVAAGGYYNPVTRQWTLPGVVANVLSWSIETRWFGSLESAYNAADDHARQVAEYRAAAEREGGDLRRARQS